MLELGWAALGAVLGYLLDIAAVRTLRGREHKRLPHARWLAPLALTVLVPLLYAADPVGMAPNLVLLSLLTVTTLTDLRAMLILNRTLLAFTIPLVVLRLWVPVEGGLLSSLAGAVMAFVIMGMLAVLSKGQVGGGDVKLYALLGFAMGKDAVLANLFLASVLGLVGTLLLLALRFRKRTDAIAFGPYIALSSICLLLV